MKIGLYNELSSNRPLGGSECSIAILAEALANNHDVDIVSHCPRVTKEFLASFWDVDLSRVRLRHVPPEHSPLSGGMGPGSVRALDSSNGCRLPWGIYQQSRAWHAALSEPYDLFVNFSISLPPFCHARRGVLIVLFPFFKPRETWPWRIDPSGDGSRLRSCLRRAYYHWEWKRRLDTYQLKLANSGYTREWSRQLWGIDCEVLYPPVLCDFSPNEKTNGILSVGRFEALSGNMKKQLEMVSAFGQMADLEAQGWEYHCVGGLSARPDDHTFFQAVSRVGTPFRAQVRANIAHSELKRLYEKAKIFWHATGYGADDRVHPERNEHFGIVTVEAMAAGCVPIVINKGGQPEIVEHGVNGFLWNSVEELKDYTRLVARDDQLRIRLSEAARLRARHFTHEKFVQRFFALLDPMLSW